MQKVEGDVLTVTLPVKDAQGKDLPKSEVQGRSWLTFAQRSRITSYSQKENVDIGYVADLSKMKEMALTVWSQEGATGWVRNRHNGSIPYGPDTVVHQDTRSDDLEYLALAISHQFFPDSFPFPPMDPSEESDPNSEPEAETPPSRRKSTGNGKTVEKPTVANA